MLVNSTATLPTALPSAAGHVSTMAASTMIPTVSTKEYTSSAMQNNSQQKETTYTKIFVGGLPYHTTDKSLREHFEVYGEIEEAVVITDRQTGKSRGYGFVTMADRSGADRAIKDPNPVIDGRKANVNLAYLGAKPRGAPNTSVAAAAAAAAQYQALSFPQGAAGMRFFAHPSSLAGAATTAYNYPTGIPGSLNPSSFFYGYPFGTPGAAAPTLSYVPMSSMASPSFAGAAEYSPALHFPQTAGATAFAPSAQADLFTGAHAMSTAGGASYGMNLAQLSAGGIPAAALGYPAQAQPGLSDTRSVIQ